MLISTRKSLEGDSFKRKGAAYMRRTVCILVLAAMVMTLMTGCDAFGLFGGSRSGSFKIDGVIKANTDREVTDTQLELWVMPLYTGSDEPIAHSSVYELKKYQAAEDGSYEIPMEEIPNTAFVIFIVETNDTTDYDVLGFLSLSVDEATALTTFPNPEEIIDTVEFGIVELMGDSSYSSFSDNTLTDNRSAFTSATFDELHENVVLHNTGQMALNVLLNTNPDPEVNDYYAIDLRMSYRTQLGSSVQNSAQVDWASDVKLRIYSSDTTSKASLFTPDGTNLKGAGVFVDPNGEYNAVQYEFPISFEDFKTHAQPEQFWELRDDSDTVLASFDMSVAMLLDDQDYPIIPITEPTYTLDEGGAVIDTVDFNWFYFESDGTTKHELTDPVLLEDIIGKTEFYLQTNSTNPVVTYMYREPGTGGNGGMEGDVATAYSFSPTLTKTAFQNVSCGYRFTLFRCSTSWGN